MSSEAGDTDGGSEKPEPNDDGEPEQMLVDDDVAIKGKQDQADDVETKSRESESTEITKENGKKKGDAQEDSNTEEQGDEDSQISERENEKDSQETEEYIDSVGSNSNSIADLDAFYHYSDDYSDSGSEKEIKALKGGAMGISKSKEKKSYQEKKPYSYGKRWSERDTEEYRSGYPSKKDSPSKTLNLEFYTNKIRSRPDGDYIDNIHKSWHGDYHKLEIHHGYIQWLFPIRENGMNFHAQELQVHEAKVIRENRLAHRRVLESYKMMLDFYGMQLKDETSGQLERAENWKERYAHLNRSMHNYLRITRILKSLGELGYEYLKFNFVKFVLEEALEKKTLNKTVNSCYNYWMETLRDDKERDELKHYADKLLSKDGDV